MPSPEQNPRAIDYVPYFRELISIQEHAIVSFKRWAGGFVFLGLTIVALAVMLNSRIPGVASPIIGIGGIFMGALAAFPYREIAPRRSRIVTYSLLKSSFEQFPRLPEDERKRLRDLADETIRKQI